MVEALACLAIPGAVAALIAAILAFSNARSLSKRFDNELSDLRFQILVLSNRITELTMDRPEASPTSQTVETMMVDVEQRTEDRQEAGVPATAADTTPAPAAPQPVASDRLTVNLSSDAAPAPQPIAPTPATPRRVPATSTTLKRVSADLQENPAVSWFTGTHIVVRVGIVVLFFGVAFLLKYAADQGWLSIELRLAGAAIIGLALIAIGWRVHRNDGRRGYALTLQGGGLGILYMTTFTAFRVYELLPAPIAFATLVVVSAGTVALAVLNDSRALAILSVVGGFAAPFLVSTGEGSHIMLFSYVTVVNLVILVVAWFKSWRELNLVGFLSTVAVGVLWGSQAYQASMFRSVEFFLVLFVLFYTAVTVLHAYRVPARVKDPIDGVLAFGVPIAAASFQTIMLNDWRGSYPPEMMAWSAIAAAVFYLAVGVVLTRVRMPNFNVLGQVYAGIGALFAILAVPFAFHAEVTAALWAAAGAGLVWLGIHYDQRYYRVLGGLTQVAAGVAMMVYLLDVWWGSAHNDVVDAFTFAGPIMAVAAIFSAYLYTSRSDMSRRSNRFSCTVLTIWGFVWWFGWGIHQIVRTLDAASAGQVRIAASDGIVASALLLFVALSVAVFEWLGGRLRWPLIRIPALLLIIPTALYLFAQVNEYGHASAAGGWVALPVTLAVYYWTLYRRDGDNWQDFYHAMGLWTIAVAGTFEAGYLTDSRLSEPGLWTSISWIVVPIILVLGVSVLGRRIPWPTAPHYDTYMKLALIPLVGTLLLWLVWSTINLDGSWQLSYMAVLNPLSIAQLAILASSLVWLRRVPVEENQRIAGYAGIVAFGFLWLTAEMARAVHHAYGMPLDMDAMLESEVLQTGYSVVWTGLALVFMFAAKRRGLRWLWLIGAGLLGVTVLKLFVVDLSNIGTLARIVSFLAVGALMLIIGYLAPIPPRQQVAKPEDELEMAPAASLE